MRAVLKCVHLVPEELECLDCKKDMDEGWITDRKCYNAKRLWVVTQRYIGNCIGCGRPRGSSPYVAHCIPCAGKNRRRNRKYQKTKMGSLTGKGRPRKDRPKVVKK